MKRPVIALVLIWLGLFLAFIGCAMLISCQAPKPGVCSGKQQRRALHHLNKALDLCPGAVAEKAAIMYPPRVYDSIRTEFLPGKVERDTVDRYVDCDSIVNAAAVAQARGEKPAVDPKKVPYQEIITRQRDTINQFRNRHVANTAEIEGLKWRLQQTQDESAGKDIAISKKDQQIKTKDRQIKDLQGDKWRLRLWLLGLAGYLVVSRVIKWKFPVIGKFLP